MKVQYFADTDTLYIEFRDRDIAQSKNLDIARVQERQIHEWIGLTKASHRGAGEHDERRGE